MPNSRLTIIPCTVLLMLAACTSHRGTMSPSPTPAPDIGVDERRNQPAAAGRARAPGEGFNIGAIRVLDPRQLIRRAALELEVENVAQVPPRATTIATQMGGYVEQTRETSDRSVWVTLRVPSSSLDAALDSLGALGRVTGKTVSADDVTEQVVDADARLKSLVAVRDRLRSLLDRAVSVADVIAAERELARVQSEIDAIERRLEYLRSNVALSELSVNANRRIVLGPLGVVLNGLGKAAMKLFVWR